jgi:hypothetical protein
MIKLIELFRIKKKQIYANYLDVESINADAEVILVFHIFFTGVELFAFVNIFVARVASEKDQIKNR